MKLLTFVELNATGIRKILKKHDKTIKKSKIMGSYLSSRTDSQASHLQQLYHDEGISAIIATIRSALEELRQLEVCAATGFAECVDVYSLHCVIDSTCCRRRLCRASTQHFGR